MFSKNCKLSKTWLVTVCDACDNNDVKTVTFDQARDQFEHLFQLAAAGETVVIQRNGQQVALHIVAETETAPRGFFAGDYSHDEVAELNRLASQAPKNPLP